MKKLLILSLIVAFVTISACSKSGETTSTPAPPLTPPPPGGGGTTLNCATIDSRFSAVVSVIIQNNCATAGCHASGSSNGPGALTNYDQIRAASARINASVQAGTMPKAGPLPTTQKNAIACWVSSGTLNN